MSSARFEDHCNYSVVWRSTHRGTRRLGYRRRRWFAVIKYSQIDVMNFRVGAHGRHLDVTLFVAFDQTIPALVSLFADASREELGAHQAVEAAAEQTTNKSFLLIRAIPIRWPETCTSDGCLNTSNRTHGLQCYTEHFDFSPATTETHTCCFRNEIRVRFFET